MSASHGIPLSLYIHIPWCIKKCPYCDFNSHAVRDELPEAAYVDALLADLEQELAQSQGRPIQSIFIGGGTPSLFSVESITRLLDGVAKRATLTSDVEVTMEANPGTFEKDKFTGFKTAGINRLSIGVQSFNNQHLTALGRVHNQNEAIAAAEFARKTFDRLNLDLMHGLPGQSLQEAMADLQQAIDLKPDHLSWYQLTIEPNTEFYSKPPQLPVDDTLWDIQSEGQTLIAAAGYEQYEVSAYAKPNSQARHNLNYWTFGDYIGIGAGAHGKLTLANGDIIRRAKQRQPKGYLNLDSRIASESTLSIEELPFEFMMNALRLTDGVTSQTFSDRTGRPFSELAPKVAEAQRKGLLIDSNEYLKPTPQGQLFLNDLLALFLEDE